MQFLVPPVEYRPAVQTVHRPFAADEKVPATQSAHAEPAKEYLPAVQLVQFAKLVELDGEDWPTAQSEQSATASWSVALVAASVR